jgi:hypothetical protein
MKGKMVIIGLELWARNSGIYVLKRNTAEGTRNLGRGRDHVEVQSETGTAPGI